ncbi:hypothetical protein ACFVH6_40180 [Spirillospora sp. NPDC127200]
MRAPTPGTTYGDGVETIVLSYGTFYGNEGGTPGYLILAAASADGREWFAASSARWAPPWRPRCVRERHRRAQCTA